jgi:hypothetical protein
MVMALGCGELGRACACGAGGGDRLRPRNPTATSCGSVDAAATAIAALYANNNQLREQLAAAQPWSAT